MARLYTNGFALGGSSANLPSEDPTQSLYFDGVDSNTYISYVGSPVRSGTHALQMSAGSGLKTSGIQIFANASTYPIFIRVPIYITTASTPVGVYPITITDTGSTQGFQLALTSSLALQVQNFSTGASVYNTGFTLTTGVWYVVEATYNPSTGASAVRVNGNPAGSGTNETASNQVLSIYGGNGSSCSTVYCVGDIAFNDASGTAQNSWCGTGQVVVAMPTADSSTTGFKAGTTATTGLWDAVNGVPPTGVVEGSATTTSQITDPTSNTTDNYVAKLQSYTAAGVPSGATIVLTRAFAVQGNSSTTSRTNGIQSTANPVIAEATGGTGTTAAATWPNGWTQLTTAYSYTPTVTLGTAPTVEFRKGTASTDYAMACQLGMLVEYQPSTGLSSSFFAFF